MLAAATGDLRRLATVFAMVAVSASVAAGCGGGGGDSVSVQTGTRPQATRPGEPALSAAAFVAKIEKADPEQTSRLCLLRKAKGESAAYANFKKGYALAFPTVEIPPKKVFAQIVKHC